MTSVGPCWNCCFALLSSICPSFSNNYPHYPDHYKPITPLGFSHSTLIVSGPSLWRSGRRGSQTLIAFLSTKWNNKFLIKCRFSTPTSALINCFCLDIVINEDNLIGRKQVRKSICIRREIKPVVWGYFTDLWSKSVTQNYQGNQWCQSTLHGSCWDQASPLRLGMKILIAVFNN